jgi:hypothetical protein
MNEFSTLTGEFNIIVHRAADETLPPLVFVTGGSFATSQRPSSAAPFFNSKEFALFVFSGCSR